MGLVYALDHVLGQWEAVGREELFAHTAHLAEIFRTGVRALGLEFFTNGAQSPALTAVSVPDEIAASQLTTWLRTELGLTISAGQAAFKDKILRIGHIGAIDGFDMLQGVAALEAGLVAMDAEIEVGAGVAAAQQVLNEYLQTSSFVSYSP